MEKDKKIVYLRFATIDSPKFVGKVVYLNWLVGTLVFLILTFFTDLPFTDVLLYNRIMYAVLVIQFIALVFFTLKHLWQYKVKRRYIKLKLIAYLKKEFLSKFRKKILLIWRVAFLLFLFPIGVFYMSVYREYIRFGIVFFPYDSSIAGFGRDPVNTGNMVRSVKGVMATHFGIDVILVVYGFYLIIFLFCLIRGK